MDVESKNNFITKYQLFATIVVTITGVGFFSYPSAMARTVGTDGWIVTILSGFIVYVLMYLIHKIVRLNDYGSLHMILENNYGKIFSIIIAIVFSVLNIMLISVGMRVFAEVIKMYLLEKTPVEFIVMIMIITGSILVRGELDVLIKFNEVSFWIMFIPIYLVMFLLCKGTDFTNVLPVFNNSIYKYMEGIALTAFSFEGFEIAYLVLPHVKQKRNISKTLFKSVVFVVVFYSAITILTVCTFGVQQTKSLIWSTLTMIKSINIPESFVEQWEGIVMVFWIIFYITTFVNIYYFSADTLEKTFKFGDIKFSSILLVPIIYLTALYPENLGEVYNLFNDISFVLPIFALAFIIIFPLVISLIKRRGGK
ncbi:endospore germination permease [Haloimpatiens sp. FM7315]|uniref:GerAB/ArcD/ProY family transporter n=1 Tax=Haloimpatiens sp. FM7315 TaxID=3298609 RepID=UPI00370AC0B1